MARACGGGCWDTKGSDTSKQLNHLRTNNAICIDLHENTSKGDAAGGAAATASEPNDASAAKGSRGVAAATGLLGVAAARGV